ncbi:MAG: hypothetical protein A2289_23165 [Deltaproteobacteria bacterium RIFOXYA12_FULL_58_15]|nr:MAG: hypothetical protein A2289_23165 [Deltaproteobacteria bacterium RIFOXYA12_FULL_58_15]OGR08302.1 MAG: hypothetical protein A2341_05735 [Deltaproteobacteria bacterium RIFOXYB12_FULL_58_9]
MSIVNARQLNAYWVLGWALVKQVLASPFVGRRGPKGWLQRLANESLGSVPKDAWALLATTSRCTGCGVCDVLGGPGESPSQWLLGMARQPSDSLLVGHEVERLVALAPRIEALCPARVNVTNWVKLVRGNRSKLGAQ